MSRPSRSLAGRMASEESGAVLVFALVFLSLFGVAVASLLGFAETSFRATIAVRGQRADAYAADGAVDGAINRVRSSLEEGRDPILGLGCTDTSVPSNGLTVTVACQGKSGSGVSTGANPLSKPKHAILTLGTSGSEVGIEQKSNATLKIHGDVFSNSTIENNGGAGSVTAVDGVVSALGACTGSGAITSTSPPLRCSNTGGGAIPADGVDPNYPPASPTPPAPAAVPSCPASKIVTFTPGTYTDAGALNSLFASCSGALYHFPAAATGTGVYYFDFRGSGAHLWTIQDENANVVGGTPNGWAPAPPRPAVPAPGGCKTESDPGANHGVQFVFGGDSRFELKSGTVELCAEPNVASQQIAFYGPESGSAVPVSLTQVPAGWGSVVRFTNPQNALVVDGLLTSDALLNGPNPLGSITLNTFAPAIPAATIVTGATLRVAHGESSTSQIGTVTATVTPGTGPPIAVSPSEGTLLHTDSFDLMALGLSPNPSALTGLTVTYDATRVSGSPIAQLDGIALDITYETLVYRAESGCIVTGGYPGTGCAVIDASGTKSALIFQGTVYVPAAAVDVKINNASMKVFGRGIICRILGIHVTPSAAYSGDTAFLPDNTARADRTVVFTACLAGVPRLRAVAKINDLGGLFPGQTVQIESWSVLPASSSGPC